MNAGCTTCDCLASWEDVEQEGGMCYLCDCEWSEHASENPPPSTDKPEEL